VDTDVLSARPAASVAVEAGDRVDAAWLERPTDDVHAFVHSPSVRAGTTTTFHSLGEKLWNRVDNERDFTARCGEFSGRAVDQSSRRDLDVGQPDLSPDRSERTFRSWAPGCRD
jgi:hypothetical protein